MAHSKSKKQNKKGVRTGGKALKCAMNPWGRLCPEPLAAARRWTAPLWWPMRAVVTYAKSVPLAAVPTELHSYKLEAASGAAIEKSQPYGLRSLGFGGVVVRR